MSPPVYVVFLFVVCVFGFMGVARVVYDAYTSKGEYEHAIVSAAAPNADVQDYEELP